MTEARCCAAGFEDGGKGPEGGECPQQPLEAGEMRKDSPLDHPERNPAKALTLAQ